MKFCMESKFWVNVTFCVDVKFGMVVQFCNDAKPCEMPSFVKTLSFVWPRWSFVWTWSFMSTLSFIWMLSCGCVLINGDLFGYIDNKTWYVNQNHMKCIYPNFITYLFKLFQLPCFDKLINLFPNFISNPWLQ